jgi:hypothetical protein
LSLLELHPPVDQSISIVADVQALDVSQASYEQRRADEQDDGERGLGHHEAIS